ncbi:hypothetical protein B0T18DRAFT_59855 [Schizothecium vesticola]|uniref:Uncharacterized protein n=1 Tax=Schizothecium vesticola TaxID=314040 RepID=A0AA40KA30_9PEZI|nr:hypothetical protein B0T18DRAFT_59855 [Schizothecium vesticola]
MAVAGRERVVVEVGVFEFGRRNGAVRSSGTTGAAASDGNGGERQGARAGGSLGGFYLYLKDVPGANRPASVCNLCESSRWLAVGRCQRPS